jgi:hypothetical protein
VLLQEARFVTGEPACLAKLGPNHLFGKSDVGRYLVCQFTLFALPA